MKKSLSSLSLPFLFLLLGFGFNLQAQNTIGVLSHGDTLVSPGYNLFYPTGHATTYLLDNCGRIVHSWPGEADTLEPGNSSYLLENGNLLRTYRDKGQAADPIWAGGGGECIEIRDWNNNRLWDFCLNDSSGRLHHDIAWNNADGTVFAIAWEYKSYQECVDAGRDTSKIVDGYLWPDQVLEIRPIYPDSFEIVWEWNVWDHLIQDYDSTKANYGVIADHPELIDLNFTSSTNDGDADWNHLNSIYFHEDYNQLVLSPPDFGEIWIIDHSTNKTQAAGHTGGLANKGGDLIYRWGNPQVYGRGDSSDQQLFFQHDPHWVDWEAGAADPYFNTIMLFNNRVGDNFSTVDIIRPEFDTYDWEYAMVGNVYGPAAHEWRYDDSANVDFYSNIISSAQRLPNGNTLICAGRPGFMFEIDGNKEVVWEYENPIVNGVPGTQGAGAPALNSNRIFRLKRYTAAYPGLAGKTLAAQGYVELNPDTTLCGNLTINIEPEENRVTAMYPNPAMDVVNIERSLANPGTVELFDLMGKLLKREDISGLRSQLDISTLPEGIYILRADHQFAGKLLIQR